MDSPFATLRWEGGIEGELVLLDQTRLPTEVVELHCRTVEDVWDAIKRLVVRGAPAIGCAAAYGVCLSLNEGGSPTATQRTEHSGNAAVERVLQACQYLRTSRPTAVNLFWALDRMQKIAADVAPEQLPQQLLAEAKAIHDEDRQMCADIGKHGADLLAELPVGSNLLTHCNTGALATGGDGTALSVIFELARRGRQPHVWVDETRPLLQGARLTAWELQQRDIACTLICDSAAAQVMSEGRVQAVITGADRIAANGDAANKIGTKSVAVLARHFDVPFYVAAPTSTFDLSLASGAQIPIEQRAAEEITHGLGSATAPAKIKVYNPAFDVTPAALITKIITERGNSSPAIEAIQSMFWATGASLGWRYTRANCEIPLARRVSGGDSLPNYLLPQRLRQP
ncbi:MAG: S-methyl-5-thioribose-1-phosphate isomerase, partial [Pirellulales bacterium]|nr:S-methyl-5-thioribose-1-phosphate isomerase [Pirellulales bacterium]